MFIILSCLFANAQANDPDPIAAPQAAPTQGWESVLGTRYPIIEERRDPYSRERGLEKDTKEIILPTLEAIGTAASCRFSLEKYLINLAVYYFNYSNPLIHIMNAAMAEKTSQLFKENEDWRGNADWDRIVGVFCRTPSRRSNAYEDFPAECPNFRSFLTYVAHGRVFPAKWISKGLDSYYKETIKKIPYVLAAVGEIYTKKDDLPLLGERLKEIHSLMRGEGIREFEDKQKKHFLRTFRDLSLIKAYRDLKAAKGQVKLLEKKLDSIKDLVPTSAAFIDSVKEKIKPINFEKVYFTENSIDDILTIDSQTVGINLQGAQDLRDGTMIAIDRYLRNNETLNLAIEEKGVFRHSPETKNWEIRRMELKEEQEEVDGEVKTPRVWVPKIHAITPKEQDVIVRALIKKNVLTPLINDDLIADEKKEEETPVDSVKKTYDDKVNDLKKKLREKVAAKKQNPKNDSEEE